MVNNLNRNNRSKRLKRSKRLNRSKSSKRNNLKHKEGGKVEPRLTVFKKGNIFGNTLLKLPPGVDLKGDTFSITESDKSESILLTLKKLVEGEMIGNNVNGFYQLTKLITGDKSRFINIISPILDDKLASHVPQGLVPCGLPRWLIMQSDEDQKVWKQYFKVIFNTLKNYTIILVNYAGVTMEFNLRKMGLTISIMSGGLMTSSPEWIRFLQESINSLKEIIGVYTNNLRIINSEFEFMDQPIDDFDVLSTDDSTEILDKLERHTDNLVNLSKDYITKQASLILEERMRIYGTWADINKTLRRPEGGPIQQSDTPNPAKVNWQRSNTWIYGNPEVSPIHPQSLIEKEDKWDRWVKENPDDGLSIEYITKKKIYDDLYYRKKNQPLDFNEENQKKIDNIGGELQSLRVQIDEKLAAEDLKLKHTESIQKKRKEYIESKKTELEKRRALIMSSDDQLKNGDVIMYDQVQHIINTAVNGSNNNEINITTAQGKEITLERTSKNWNFYFDEKVAADQFDREELPKIQLETLDPKERELKRRLDGYNEDIRREYQIEQEEQHQREKAADRAFYEKYHQEGWLSSKWSRETDNARKARWSEIVKRVEKGELTPLPHPELQPKPPIMTNSDLQNIAKLLNYTLELKDIITLRDLYGLRATAVPIKEWIEEKIKKEKQMVAELTQEVKTVASTKKYRVIAPVIIRVGKELDSEQSGTLEIGAEINVIEEANVGGTTRVSFNEGWTSIISSQGKQLLEEIVDSPRTEVGSPS